MSGKDFWNKCDFNRRRKTDIEPDNWTSSGKQFQIMDAATGNERWLKAATHQAN